MLSTSIELHCRDVALARLVADSHNHKLEDITRLDHELSEATSSLKSALDQVSDNESRAVQAEVEL